MEYLNVSAVNINNCINGNVNQGIDIGLMGSTYDNFNPDAPAIKNTEVANITGSDSRHAVHVENGKHFIIRNVNARNIPLDFSKRADIDNVTISIFGSDNFVINNINLNNSKLDDKSRGIKISSDNATSFVAITNGEMKRATLEMQN